MDRYRLATSKRTLFFDIDFFVLYRVGCYTDARMLAQSHVFCETMKDSWRNPVGGFDGWFTWGSGQECEDP